MDTQAFLRQGLQRGYIDMRAATDQPGLSVKVQRALLRRAGWEAAHPGLWVPDPGQTSHRVDCLLALMHFGSTAAVTGQSALFLLGVVRNVPEAVELLRPAELWKRPREGTCVHWARDFGAVRTVSVQGVRMTWAPRALAEHARHTGFTPLVRVMADAMQQRHCALGLVEAELARGRFPGCAVLRRAVTELRGGQSHSGYEHLARRLLGEAGVAVSERPLPVLAGTVGVAEVDIPFFEVGYGVEIDGPHHLLAEQAARDRARDRMLDRDHGITIDRYFWFELEEQPDRFVREVTAELRRRGGLMDRSRDERHARRRSGACESFLRLPWPLPSPSCPRGPTVTRATTTWWTASTTRASTSPCTSRPGQQRTTPSR